MPDEIARSGDFAVGRHPPFAAKKPPAPAERRAGDVERAAGGACQPIATRQESEQIGVTRDIFVGGASVDDAEGAGVSKHGELRFDRVDRD